MKRKLFDIDNEHGPEEIKPVLDGSSIDSSTGASFTGYASMDNSSYCVYPIDLEAAWSQTIRKVMVVHCEYCRSKQPGDSVVCSQCGAPLKGG